MASKQTEMEFLLEVGAKMSSSYQKVMKQASAALKTMANASDEAKTASGQLKTSITQQERKLENLRDEYANVVLEKGKNSREAKKLKAEYKKLSSEVTKSKKRLSDSTSALDDVQESSGRARKGITAMTVAMGNLASAGVQKLMGGISNAVSSVFSLSEATREYRTNASKLSVTMAANGYSADYTAEAYKSLYGYLGDDQTVTTTLSNLAAMNMEQGDLNTLIAGMQGVWAAYGDSIPLDALAESITDTANTKTVTGNLADALVRAGISESVFNEQLKKCTSTQEAQKLITGTLYSAYGGLKTAYDETAASTIAAKEAEAEYNAVTASIGAQMEPVTTALKEGWNSVLGAFSGMLAGIDMQAVSAKIGEATTWITDTALPAVTGFFSSLGEIPGKIGETFSSAVTWVTGTWTDIKSAFSDAAAWISGTFTTAWDGAVNGLAGIFGGDGIGGKISAFITSIKAVFTGIKDWIAGAFNTDFGSAWSSVASTMADKFGAVTSLIKAPINAVVRALNWIIDKVNNIAVTLPEWGILGDLAGQSFGVHIDPIPELATGGIVTDPTLAMIGEGRGPEAVLPLDQLDRFMSGTGAPITFAPVINVTGGGDVRGQVRQALDEGYQAFEQNMRRYQRQQMRTAFAH